MGKQFGKAGLKKRNRIPKKFDPNKRRIKENSITEKYNRHSLEEQSNDAASQKVTYGYCSMLDGLLVTLQPCNKKSLAHDAFKKRQSKNNVKGQPEDNEAEDSQSPSTSQDYSVEEGSGNESNLQEPSTLCIEEEDEGSESEDVREAFDTNEEQELGVKTKTVVEDPASRSSFYSHLDYELKEIEVGELLKKKWNYQWDVPAFGMSNCKWVGTGECFLKDVNVNSDRGLKRRLHEHWSDVYSTSGSNDLHSSQQMFFFSLCNSYRDILHCNKKSFYRNGLKEDLAVMDGYVMHCLNHIIRTRDVITKNDSKVGKHQKNTKDELLDGDGFLDHGFTRPKVLILLPFRSITNRVVNRIVQLTPEAYKANVEHMSRFSDEFGTPDDEDNVNTDELTGTIKDLKSQKPSKPPDHLALFGGNVDDRFMVGIKFTRKSIKLFSDFYSSDLIVASPLALLKKIEEAKIDKEKNVDYLSSIEVLIIDHADVITMQNWTFLTSVLEQLNCIPSKQHGTDIMRIRKWYLDGHARFYRQTIILSCYANPDINASFNRQCINYQGKVKLVCQYKGVLPKIPDQVRQIYQRFDVSSVVEVDDARFDYFIQKVFPKIKDSDEGGVMIFASSYFEFVRLRNFLKSQNASFCLLGDYTEPRDVTRLRHWFRRGEKKIMLYTERVHFYRRYKIGGVKNLIIYSLPERKEFYPEVVNMLEGADDMTCTVLFSQFDHLRLERIVGTASARRMITSEKGVFVFC